MNATLLFHPEQNHRFETILQQSGHKIDNNRARSTKKRNSAWGEIYKKSHYIHRMQKAREESKKKTNKMLRSMQNRSFRLLFFLKKKHLVVHLVVHFMMNTNYIYSLTHTHPHPHEVERAWRGVERRTKGYMLWVLVNVMSVFAHHSVSVELVRILKI